MTIHTTTRNPLAIANAIRRKERFATSGALSGEYVDSLDSYVIRSYDEPIAAYHYGAPPAALNLGPNPGYGIVTTRKWSVTTSRHTNVARRALESITKTILTRCERISGSGLFYT